MVATPEPAAGAPDEVELDRLGTGLLTLNRLLERAHARVGAPDRDGVEGAAVLLLACLVRTGPQRLSALAEEVHSEVSTVSRQVAQLVGSGLVARRPDPSDGRASLLAATERGIESAEAGRRRRNATLARVLADWTAVERAEFVELLVRFTADYAQVHRRG